MRISEDVKLDFEDVLIVPKRSELNSRSEIYIKREIVGKYSRERIELTPVIASNMYNTGTFAMAKAFESRDMWVALHKYYSVEELIEFLHRKRNVIITTGISDKDLEKIYYILENNEYNNFICVDVPNGYIPNVYKFIKKIRDKFVELPTIMVGNVVTPSITEQLILSGADIVKVGIGSGAFCSTRLVAGVGYPQLSAIVECADVAHGLGAHICSDGGIKCVGDICKAFCAGADFVMCGGMFVGYEENEGDWSTDGTKKYLNAFGMSSKYANEKFSGGLKDYRASEGKEKMITCKGGVRNILQEIEGGLRSCGSYIGARRLKDFPKCASFVKVNRTHNKALE